jgi:hypothetical protein
MKKILPGVLAVVCLLASCRMESKVDWAPDGLRVIEAVVNGDGLVKVRISNQDGETLFEKLTRASGYQKWSVNWVNNRKIHFTSSDVGSLVFEESDDGQWISYNPSRKMSPNGLYVCHAYQHTGNLLAVSILKARGTNADAAEEVIVRIITDYIIDDLIDCATWDGNERLSVRCRDEEHAWVQTSDRKWVEHESEEGIAGKGVRPN